MRSKRVVGERGEVRLAAGTRTARVIPVEPDQFDFGGMADTQTLRRVAETLGLRANFKQPQNGPGCNTAVIAVLRLAKIKKSQLSLRKTPDISDLLERAAEVMARFMRIRPKPGPNKKTRQKTWIKQVKLTRAERRGLATAVSQAQLAYALNLRSGD